MLLLKLRRLNAMLIFVTLILIISCKDDTESISVIPSSDLSEHPLYSNYNFSDDENIIDIGIQPLSIPPGIIGELFGHDGVLLDTLADMGYELRIHPFYKSADSNYFLEQGDLEFVTGGDMPAILSCVNMDTVVTSLIKYGFSSIIAKDIILISDLKGEKIAYPAISNAHFSLLEALHNAGLKEKDVCLIPMPLLQMAEALNEDRIDAFITWEPNTSTALSNYEDFVVLHRSLSTSYLYFAKSFTERKPEIVRLIIASQIRSMQWLRSSDINIQTAVRWLEEERKNIDSKTGLTDIKRYSEILKNDLLDISAIGTLPKASMEESGMLYREFMFLKDEGEIDDDADWEKVKDSFNPSLMDEVMANSNYYSLWNYDFLEMKVNK